MLEEQETCSRINAEAWREGQAPDLCVFEEQQRAGTLSVGVTQWCGGNGLWKEHQGNFGF